MTSLFDLYKIGVGPSSSHTMGPMRAACRFAQGLAQSRALAQVERVQAELFGSLALTGLGHGTDRAVLLGLAGNEPAGIDPAAIAPTVASIRETGRISVAGQRSIPFVETRDLLFQRSIMFPPGAQTQHPNGLRLTAFDRDGAIIEQRTYFSIGGGFIVEDGAEVLADGEPEVALPYSFHTAADLLEVAHSHSLRIDQVMMANECARLRHRDPTISDEAIALTIRIGIDAIWQAMRDCIDRGIATQGILPGGLNVRRRAYGLARRLEEKEKSGKPGDPLAPLDWVTAYAMAVNEENAGGGRVVTAPTNGAAGVVPAVARYYERLIPEADHEGIVRYFLTSAAIGILYNENASI